MPDTEECESKKIAAYLSALNPLLLLSYPEGSLEILEEAERLARRLNDDRSLAAIYSKFALFHSVTGSTSIGMKYSLKCFDAAEKIGDVESMGETSAYICPTLFFSGNVLEAATISRRVFELLEEQHRERDILMGTWTVFSNQCGWGGLTLGLLGEFEEGKAILDKGLKYARKNDDVLGTGWLEMYYSYVSYAEGDADSSINHSRLAIECIEETGVKLFHGMAWSFLGAGYYLLGDYKAAKNHAKKGLEHQKETGAPVLLSYLNYYLSLAHLSAGHLEEARECAEEALKLSKENEAKLFECFSLMALGRIEGEADSLRIEIAEGSLRQSISLANEMMIKTSSAQGYLFLGEIFEHANRKEEALENLKKAEGMYQGMGVGPRSYWLTRTREALARLEQD
jgi:tetratricopeptide (TPR) repeat protein